MWRLFIVVLLLLGVLAVPAPASAEAWPPTGIQLYAGWNLIVYAGPQVQPADIAPEGTVCIWGHNNLTKEWLLWALSLPWHIISLHLLQPYHGYWVQVEADVFWQW